MKSRHSVRLALSRTRAVSNQTQSEPEDHSGKSYGRRAKQRSMVCSDVPDRELGRSNIMLKGLLLAGVATIASGFLGVVYEMTGKKRYNIFEFMIYIQGFGLVFGLALTLALRLPLLNSK